MHGLSMKYVLKGIGSQHVTTSNVTTNNRFHVLVCTQWLRSNLS